MKATMLLHLSWKCAVKLTLFFVAGKQDKSKKKILLRVYAECSAGALSVLAIKHVLKDRVISLS
jgi:hypothetical protein